MTSVADEQDPLRSEAVDWLVRIQAAPGDVALRAGLDDWLAASPARRRAYGSVEKVWRLTGELPVAAPGVVSLAAARTFRMRRAAALAMAALAACVALYFLPALQLRLMADHMTGVAELRELRLDDGSTVHLDAGSAIAVDYEASRRQVTLLAGQAFFQVVRATDRPFVVTAGDVKITVTGTAFDVRASNDGVAVAVQSGRVEVATSKGDRPAATLTRGERLTIDRAGVVARSEVMPDDVAAWRERRLVVDGATLGDVVEELDRHYPGAIVLRDRTLAARRVTGVFDLSRPLEALQTVVGTQRGSVTSLTQYLLVVSGP